jgi:hypothetical protein
MKKVTLLLPDEVVSVGGTSRSSTRETLPTNAQTVMQALTSNDYHLNCFFQVGTVAVVSIEDVEPEVIRVHSASESGRETGNEPVWPVDGEGLVRQVKHLVGHLFKGQTLRE